MRELVCKLPKLGPTLRIIVALISVAMITPAKAAYAQGCNNGLQSISPCTSSARILVDSAGPSILYTITNNDHLNSATFTLSCSGPNNVIKSCHVPTTVVVPAAGHLNFTLTYTAGSRGGKGVLQTYLSGGDGDLSVNDTVNARSIWITPKNLAVSDSDSTTYYQRFSVTNLSDTVQVITLKKSCDSGVSPCNGPYPSSLTIAALGTASDSIQYSTYAAGVGGVVRLIDSVSTQPYSIDTGYVVIHVPSPAAALAWTTPHNGDNRAINACAASCFDLVLSYSTPAYQSLGAARSATLVYTSAQARPTPTVQLDVSDTTAVAAGKYELQVKNGSGAFLSIFKSGGNAVYYTGLKTADTSRLAAQFDATSLATGVQADTAVVTSYWTGTHHFGGTTMSRSVAVPVLINNQQSSPFGAGWSLAGLARLYFSADSLAIALTDGAGSIMRFTRTCKTTCNATAVADFTYIYTRISGGVVQAFERHARDGSMASFNPSGYLTYTQDVFGNTTWFTYDGSNRIQYVVFPANDTLKFAYNGAGKLSTITDPGGRVTTFSVNGSGDLASITDATNTVAFQGTYDSHHILTQNTDRAGNTWKYVYDFANKLISDSTPSVKVDTTITGTGSLTTQRLGAHQRSLEYLVVVDTTTAYGTSTNPAPKRTSSALRAALFGATGDSTTLMVDAFYLPLRTEQSRTRDTTIVTLDASERITSTVERRNNRTVAKGTITYSGPRVASSVDSLTGASATYAYDTTYDIPTLITGTFPSVRNYLNSNKTWIDSTRVSSNPDTTKDTVTSYRHDSRGRVTMVIDPKRDSTITYYSSSGLQNVDSVASGTHVVRYRYDSYGRVVRVVDPQEDSSSLAMDKLNRIDTVVAANGGRTVYGYDSAGNVTSVTDAKAQVYGFHYNALGWKDVSTDATSAHLPDSVEFTRTGAVRAHVNRNRKRTTFVFDSLGRVIKDSLADGRKTTFAYDSAGLWVAAANGESIDTITTDSSTHTSTQVAVRGSRRYVVTTTSDASGLVRSSVFKRNTTAVQSVAYGFDADSRLDSLSVTDSGSATARVTTFGYNADGMMTFRRLPTYKLGSSFVTLDSASFAVTADHMSYSVYHSATSLQSFAELYTRDSLDRITSRTNGLLDTTMTFAYDKMGELTNWKTLYYATQETCTPDSKRMDGEVCVGSNPVTLQNTTYSYDSVGNRTDGSPTIATGNRLTSWQGFTLTYDSVGNLVHKQKTGFDQLLAWNSTGQLDSAVTTTDSVRTVRFGYDGFGRRVRKTVVVGAGSATTSLFIYDGSQIVAVMDTSGNRLRTYAYYPGVDQPHSVQIGQGLRYYYTSETGAGSVWGVIDTTRAVVNRYRYAPFGTLTDSLEGVANPYRFAGREYDPETQLYFNRARYYDPTLSRFISEDPIGLSGGINSYSYANGDPVNANDPNGMDCSWSGGSYICPDPWLNPLCLPKTDGSCTHGGGGGGICISGYEIYGDVNRWTSGPSAGQVISISNIQAVPVFAPCSSGNGRPLFSDLGGPPVPIDAEQAKKACDESSVAAIKELGSDLLLLWGIGGVVKTLSGVADITQSLARSAKGASGVMVGLQKIAGANALGAFVAYQGISLVNSSLGDNLAYYTPGIGSLLRLGDEIQTCYMPELPASTFSISMFGASTAVSYP